MGEGVGKVLQLHYCAPHLWFAFLNRYVHGTRAQVMMQLPFSLTPFLLIIHLPLPATLQVGNLLLPNDFGFVFAGDTPLEYILLFNVILGQLQANGKMVGPGRAGSSGRGVGGAREGRVIGKGSW